MNFIINVYLRGVIIELSRYRTFAQPRLNFFPSFIPDFWDELNKALIFLCPWSYEQAASSLCCVIDVIAYNVLLFGTNLITCSLHTQNSCCFGLDLGY